MTVEYLTKLKESNMKRIFALLALCSMGIALQAEWSCPGWLYSSDYATKEECEKNCSDKCVKQKPKSDDKNKYATTGVIN